MQAATSKKENLAARLAQLNLSGLTAWMLEIMAPFSILGAQLLYLGAPVARLWFDEDALHNVARSLENPQTLRDLAAFISDYEEPVS